jgi:hypothetical protein
MSIAIIVAFVVVFDVIIITLVMRALASAVKPLGEEFPAVEPAPAAVRRRFQSLKIGLINLGWSVHIAIDRGYLHLRPARLVRIMGFPALSIPWSAITVVERGHGYSMIRVGTTEIVGPTWAFAPDGPPPG